jgi:ATP-binding cassette, subfamily B, multidrug efflux pump
MYMTEGLMGGRLLVYRRLLGYLRPYWRHVVLAYVSALLATLLSLIVPQIIKRAIDDGLTQDRPQALFAAGGLILGIAVVRAGISFGHRYFGEWITHRLAYELRNHFYSSVQHLPFAFHDRAQTGDLISPRRNVLLALVCWN